MRAVGTQWASWPPALHLSSFRVFLASHRQVFTAELCSLGFPICEVGLWAAGLGRGPGSVGRGSLETCRADFPSGSTFSLSVSRIAFPTGLRTSSSFLAGLQGLLLSSEAAAGGARPWLSCLLGPHCTLASPPSVSSRSLGQTPESSIPLFLPRLRRPCRPPSHSGSRVNLFPRLPHAAGRASRGPGGLHTGPFSSTFVPPSVPDRFF